LENKHKKNPLLKTIEVIITIVLVAMVAMIFANALARYLFNSGFPIFEELSRFAFIWVSILGSILVYFENGHVGVDMLTNALKGRNKLIVQLLGDVVVLIALVVITIGGWSYFIDTATVLSPATNLPTGIISSSAVIMGITMFSKLIMNIKDHIAAYQEFKKNREFTTKKEAS